MPTTLYTRDFGLEPDDLTGPGAGLSDRRLAGWQVVDGTLRLPQSGGANVLPDRNFCAILGLATPSNAITDLRDGALAVRIAAAPDSSSSSSGGGGGDAVLLDARRSITTGGGHSVAFFATDRAAQSYAVATGHSGLPTVAGLALFRHPAGNSNTPAPDPDPVMTVFPDGSTNANDPFGGEPPILLAFAPLRAETFAALDGDGESIGPRLQITLRAAGLNLSAMLHAPREPVGGGGLFPTPLLALTVRDESFAVADAGVDGGLRAPSGIWGIRGLRHSSNNTPADPTDDVWGTRLQALTLDALSPLDDNDDNDGGDPSNPGNGGLPDPPATLAGIAAALARLPGPLIARVGLPIGLPTSTPANAVATPTSFRALPLPGDPTPLLPTDLARGFVRFVGGPARGLWHPIASYDVVTGRIVLSEPLPAAPVLGDRLIFDGWR